MPPDDPDSRRTQEIPASIGDLARLRGEVMGLLERQRDQDAELASLRNQLAVAQDEIRTHQVATVIGGKTIRITLLIQAE